MGLDQLSQDDVLGAGRWIRDHLRVTTGVAAVRPIEGDMGVTVASMSTPTRESGLRTPHADATSNAARVRVSRLNSMPTRWMGAPRPRYLSA